MDPATTHDLAGTLAEVLAGNENVVIDLGFTWSDYRAGAVDALLAHAFFLAQEKLDGGRRILLLFNKPVLAGDLLANAIQGSAFRDHVLAVDSGGNRLDWSTPTWTPSNELLAASAITARTRSMPLLRGSSAAEGCSVH